ncbi:hypothetical protein AC249_AIPGENE28606 [Exaiptasia diaphana]|nr:hypothetical protein AC249_AIPGENE28606 [Exaiptasia diaphana]
MDAGLTGLTHGRSPECSRLKADPEPVLDQLTDTDTFSVEYEPPETGDEDNIEDDDESDAETAIVIPSSSEDEDPGVEGGDEYEEDGDSDDSWECTECWTKNYQLTTVCVVCWKKRTPCSKVPDNTHLCIICLAEKRNASIIHGKTGHQVCCITCAEKLKADIIEMFEKLVEIRCADLLCLLWAGSH